MVALSHKPLLMTLSLCCETPTVAAEISQGCSSGLQAAEIVLGALLPQQPGTSPRWDGGNAEEQEGEGGNPSRLLG